MEHKNLFRPDVILTSTDDPAQLLLEAALHENTRRQSSSTRATVALPFGPDAAFSSREKTEMLAQADGVVGVSNYVASYIREHSGIKAIHVPIAPADPGPHPKVGAFDNPLVTLVNPCAVKGIKVFLELAKALPDVAFAGVPTWGTTPEDLAAMRRAERHRAAEGGSNQRPDAAHPCPACSFRVGKARSRIVVEAMLAGVPVMASNLGGASRSENGGAVYSAGNAYPQLPSAA